MSSANCGGAAKFRRQWTNRLECSAACTTSTRAVTKHLHTCTEDAPILDCSGTVETFLCDSGAEYKCTDLLTYLC